MAAELRVRKHAVRRLTAGASITEPESLAQQTGWQEMMALLLHEDLTGPPLDPSAGAAREARGLIRTLPPEDYLG